MEMLTVIAFGVLWLESIPDSDLGHVQDGFEYNPAVGIAKNRIGGPFGMRHHAKDIALAVANSGDVVGGSVWIESVSSVARFITISE